MNKYIEFYLCVFFGYIGAHKFYKGDKKMGILYLCTLGLFYMGWIHDIRELYRKVKYSTEDEVKNNSSSVINNNSPKQPSSKTYSYTLENGNKRVFQRMYNSNKYSYDGDEYEIYIELYSDETKAKIFSAKNDTEIGDIIKPEYVKEIIENELDYGTLDIKRDITDEGTVVYKGIANFKKYIYN